MDLSDGAAAGVGGLLDGRAAGAVEDLQGSPALLQRRRTARRGQRRGQQCGQTSDREEWPESWASVKCRVVSLGWV